MRAAIYLLLFVLLLPAATSAQRSCGIVSEIRYPVASMAATTLARGFDDFRLYRERFGGRHVGLDVAFNQYGEPVVAAARGVVTYADPNGWDTEKGVVIVAHDFADGSRFYTLYGHMEETEDITFPAVGTCVQAGDVIGVVGWPSRGAPHLHYEVRDFMPADGGPGYITANPLTQGWFHPLDFTAEWQVRLTPYFRAVEKLREVPRIPPQRLADGTRLIAAGDFVEVQDAGGTALWRVQMSSEVRQAVALPDRFVAAQAVDGQMIVVQEGRYRAVWQRNSELPFVALEDVLLTASGSQLMADDANGLPVWALALTGNTITELRPDGHGGALVVTREAGTAGYTWRSVSASGQITREEYFALPPLTTPTAEGWMVLSGAQLERLTMNPQTRIPFAALAQARGIFGTLKVDEVGTVYVYHGDFGQTLSAYNRDGTARWQVTHPPRLLNEGLMHPPLMLAERCRLLTLDIDGALNIFDAQNGDIVRSFQLYAGGERTRSPLARLLEWDGVATIRVGAGFLSVFTLALEPC